MKLISTKSLNLAFLRSEQKVSKNLIKKKMVVRNAYYGKIQDGESFPLNSGTQIKGQKLARVGVPTEQVWEPVQDGLCSTNACEDKYEIISNGNEEFFFSLVKFGVRTDWICLEALSLREVPHDEIAHLEDGLRNANRFVQEEFRRSRFLGMGRNKFATILAEDGSTGLPATESIVSNDGAEQLPNGYVFETLSNGEMNQNAVRVCVEIDKLGLIGTLTLDNLDTAAMELEYEDEMYLDGTGLFDVLLASGRLPNQLAIQEDNAMNNAASYGNVPLDLRQTYGVEKVVRNYGLRRDIHAMRFYPDVDFNAALLASDGYAFDDQDPETWPRFKRVHAYRPAKANVSGIKFVVNQDYIKAPFGISTILTPRVISVMSLPDVGNFSSATKAENFSYDGIAQWKNPDWKENVKRTKGFWLMHYRMAAKPNRPEEGYSWFHRLDNRLTFGGLRSSIREETPLAAVAPYCYENMGNYTDPESGGNPVMEIED